MIGGSPQFVTQPWADTLPARPPSLRRRPFGKEALVTWLSHRRCERPHSSPLRLNLSICPSSHPADRETFRNCMGRQP